MDALGKLYGYEPGDAVTMLVATFTAALQAYRVRAAASGQSFEHMVLLEAAVQGWFVTALPLDLLYQYLHACVRLYTHPAMRRKV